LMGCQPRPAHVVFVLPDGFRGGFALERDPGNGQKLPKVDGEYVIHIGKDGRAKLESVRFLDSFLMTGRYESGKELWVQKHWNDKLPPGAIGLFGGHTLILGSGTDGKGQQVTDWFFVGTEEEYVAWQGGTSPFRIGSVQAEKKK